MKPSCLRDRGRNIRRKILIPALLLALPCLFVPAGQCFGAEFVFTVHNRTHNSFDNYVSAFSVDASTGGLTPVPGSPFPTMGQGREGGYFAATRITSTAAGSRLYVSNNHSDTITGFTINPGDRSARRDDACTDRG